MFKFRPKFFPKVTRLCMIIKSPLKNRYMTNSPRRQNSSNDSPKKRQRESSTTNEKPSTLISFLMNLKSNHTEKCRRSPQWRRWVEQLNSKTSFFALLKSGEERSKLSLVVMLSKEKAHTTRGSDAFGFFILCWFFGSFAGGWDSWKTVEWLIGL